MALALTDEEVARLELASHGTNLVRNGLLRSLRIGWGMSQSKLAELVGVEPSTITRWENQSRFPRHEHAIRLASLFRQLEASRS